MRRFEKAAEENTCRKDEQKIDLIIQGPERIAVTSEAKSKERSTKTSW
jgi:hypothetical protein